MDEQPIKDYTVNFLIESVDTIKGILAEDESNNGDDKDNTLCFLQAVRDSLIGELNDDG